MLSEGGVTSSIPPISTYRSSKFISPRLIDVFGESDITKLFAREMYECYMSIEISVPRKFRILSLGSGDCKTEISIVKLLKEFGMEFEFLCTDLNPTVSDFANSQAVAEGVSQFMSFAVVNLNDTFPEGRFDCVLANHSLHHFIELEYIFDQVKVSLREWGRFIISDMIGRNGHARWPEALVFVEHLWEFLPITKRVHTRSGCIHEKYINYDCTISDPYEGVRAQDILRLLLERFCFAKFVGHGNVVDIFVDRIYGNNFSPDSEEDRRFIDYAERLNTSLIDAGIVKPTAMFATLCKNQVECIYSRWDPVFSLRSLEDCASNEG